MYVVTVEFLLRRGAQARFLPLIMTNAAASLTREAGCRQFDVCTDPSCDERIFLYEIYDTASDFEFHLETPHFQHFLAEIDGLVAEKEQRVFVRHPHDADFWMARKHSSSDGNP
jgi:quinol monooxygenase YgiN